jgi:hypothetical protein
MIQQRTEKVYFQDICENMHDFEGICDLDPSEIRFISLCIPMITMYATGMHVIGS